MSFDKERIRAVKVERMSHRVMQHHAQPSEDNEECKAGEEEPILRCQNAAIVMFQTPRLKGVSKQGKAETQLTLMD